MSETREAIEATLYGPLERLMGGRHSMSPMRAEHEAVGRLIEDLGAYRAHVPGCSWSAVEGMALRRILFLWTAFPTFRLVTADIRACPRPLGRWIRLKYFPRSQRPRL